MSNVTRTQLFPNGEEANRKATDEELRTVPAMTRDECREIMKSPEYKNSALVRELIQASLAKSDVSAQAERRFDGSLQDQHQTGDEVLAKAETVKAMMRDKRYKIDPLYRLEVQQKLANLTAMDNAEVSPDDLRTPNTSVSIGVSSSPYHGADLRVNKFHRVELGGIADDSQAPRGSASQVKPSKPVREPFSS